MVKIKNFVVAFFISILVFTTGLLIGFTIERSITSSIETKINDIQSLIQELDIELLYLETSSANSCPVINEVIRDTNNQLDDFASRINQYSEDQFLFNRNELNASKKAYTILLLRDWLFHEKIKQGCNLNISTILYFYTKEDCTECVIQGNILTLIKNEFKGDVMIFPFDTDLGIKNVNILERAFNVTEYPSVVVSNKAYSGILTKDQVKDLICSESNSSACSE